MARQFRRSDLLISNGTVLYCIMELAILIGDREAMALQQVHYWCELNEDAEKQDTHFFPVEGETEPRWWCYNTWTDWREKNFPCWSYNTLRRVFERLEDSGLIIKKPHGNHNKGNWYAIDYDRLNRLVGPKTHPAQNGQGSKTGNDPAQNEQGSLPKMGNQPAQDGQSTGNTETTRDYSETSDDAPQSVRGGGLPKQGKTEDDDPYAEYAETLTGKEAEPEPDQVSTLDRLLVERAAVANRLRATARQPYPVLTPL